MAGHLPLRKQDEPVLFNLVEAIKNRMFIDSQGHADFDTFTVMFKSKPLNIMRLSKDYVENPTSERAFTVGKVNVASITDEHISLTHQIDVEVHLILKDNGQVEVKDIFWVA